MTRDGAVTTGLFRIGIIEVSPGMLRIRNRTYDRTLKLTPEEEARWREWLERWIAKAGVRLHGDTA